MTRVTIKAALSLSSSGPTGSRDADRDAQDLPVPRGVFAEGRHAGPLRGDDVQRGSVVSTEHAGKRAAVERNCLEPLASLGDAHAALVGYVCIPGGPLCIETDSVRGGVAEVGPHAPTGQTAV